MATLGALKRLKKTTLGGANPSFSIPKADLQDIEVLENL